jgi:hypothetical protein
VRRRSLITLLQIPTYPEIWATADLSAACVLSRPPLLPQVYRYFGSKKGSANNTADALLRAPVFSPHPARRRRRLARLSRTTFLTYFSLPSQWNLGGGQGDFHQVELVDSCHCSPRYEGRRLQRRCVRRQRGSGLLVVLQQGAFLAFFSLFFPFSSYVFPPSSTRADPLVPQCTSPKLKGLQKDITKCNEPKTWGFTLDDGAFSSFFSHSFSY